MAQEAHRNCSPSRTSDSRSQRSHITSAVIGRRDSAQLGAGRAQVLPDRCERRPSRRNDRSGPRAGRSMWIVWFGCIVCSFARAANPNAPMGRTRDRSRRRPGRISRGVRPTERERCRASAPPEERSTKGTEACTRERPSRGRPTGPATSATNRAHHRRPARSVRRNLGPAPDPPGARRRRREARAIVVEDPDHGRSPPAAARRSNDVIPSSPAPSGRPPADPGSGTLTPGAGSHGSGSRGSAPPVPMMPFVGGMTVSTTGSIVSVTVSDRRVDGVGDGLDDRVDGIGDVSTTGRPSVTVSTTGSTVSVTVSTTGSSASLTVSFGSSSLALEVPPSATSIRTARNANTSSRGHTPVTRGGVGPASPAIRTLARHACARDDLHESRLRLQPTKLGGGPVNPLDGLGHPPTCGPFGRTPRWPVTALVRLVSDERG